jgi:N-acetylglucosamine-6-sulfatase
MVVVDDMRFDEWGGGGHDFLKTPNIDRLAEEGFNFTQAYHAVPLCSPNRASILTGQYPSKHGITDNTSRNQASFLLPLFPKYLQKEGYRTAHVGKWHMGNSANPRPGYDYWVSFEGQGKTYDPDLYENGGFHKVEGYITDIFTDRIIRFIQDGENSDQPFFAYLGHKAIHPEAVQLDDGTVDLNMDREFIPARRHSGLYNGKNMTRSPNVPVVPQADDGKPVIQRAFILREEIVKKEPLWEKELDVSDHVIQKRAEMMLAVDESLGKILATLEEMDIRDNTVILFTSDNGYFFGEHGFAVERRMPYQESIRTPLIANYPQWQNSGRKINGRVVSIDLAATIMDLVGVKCPNTIQGVSFLPLILGESNEIRDATFVEFYSHENPFPWTAQLDYRVVLKGQYKYIRWIRFEGMEELYDLNADPYEKVNLANLTAFDEVLVDMRSQLRKLQLKALGLDD